MRGGGQDSGNQDGSREKGTTVLVPHTYGLVWVGPEGTTTLAAVDGIRHRRLGPEWQASAAGRIQNEQVALDPLVPQCADRPDASPGRP